MKFGAVIAAAGMSRRMKEFKQMIKIDGMSFAERVVDNFRKAGIEEIVMVTGFRGQELEDALGDPGITFIRNTKYESTEMFDSVCLGLENIRERCDHVFFCPVDVPLFSSDTVLKEKEKAEDADVIIPVYGKVTGHPVLMNRQAVDHTLGYNGDNGMRGAYLSFESEKNGRLMYLEVDDRGSLMDADTKEEYNELIRLYEENRS